MRCRHCRAVEERFETVLVIVVAVVAVVGRVPELHRQRQDLRGIGRTRPLARRARLRPGPPPGQPAAHAEADGGAAPAARGEVGPPRGARRGAARRRGRDRGAHARRARAGRSRRCARRSASSSSRATSAARARASRRSTSRPRSSASCASSGPRSCTRWVPAAVGYRYGMAQGRRYELDELLIRPGTYFNPQTEVLVVVDDSPSMDTRSSTSRSSRAPTGC